MVERSDLLSSFTLLLQIRKMKGKRDEDCLTSCEGIYNAKQRFQIQKGKTTYPQRQFLLYFSPLNIIWTSTTISMMRVSEMLYNLNVFDVLKNIMQESDWKDGQMRGISRVGTATNCAISQRYAHHKTVLNY